MAVLLGWFFGALAVVAIVAVGIEAARKKAGRGDRIGSVIYSIWVCLALYGAGAREDYDFVQAGFYVIAGLCLLLFARLTQAEKRSAPKPLSLGD